MKSMMGVVSGTVEAEPEESEGQCFSLSFELLSAYTELISKGLLSKPSYYVS